mmetsp:Transcript_111778/g.311005  ORF Transcript_111778/g.311005 Transcript_111778/m.311005 type:complete len:83 (+) Transcript_111778:973-1221(+)
MVAACSAVELPPCRLLELAQRQKSLHYYAHACRAHELQDHLLCIGTPLLYSAWWVEHSCLKQMQVQLLRRALLFAYRAADFF